MVKKNKLYSKIVYLQRLYKSIYRQREWSIWFSIFWKCSIFHLFSLLIGPRWPVLVLRQNKWRDRDDCRENSPNISSDHCIQKRQRTDGNAIHSLNCLEPKILKKYAIDNTPNQNCHNKPKTINYPNFFLALQKCQKTLNWLRLMRAYCKAAEISFIT